MDGNIHRYASRPSPAPRTRHHIRERFDNIGEWITHRDRGRPGDLDAHRDELPPGNTQYHDPGNNAHRHVIHKDFFRLSGTTFDCE